MEPDFGMRIIEKQGEVEPQPPIEESVELGVVVMADVVETRAVAGVGVLIEYLAKWVVGINKSR